jgi:hypothetical protein
MKALSSGVTNGAQLDLLFHSADVVSIDALRNGGCVALDDITLRSARRATLR